MVLITTVSSTQVPLSSSTSLGSRSFDSVTSKYHIAFEGEKNSAE